MLNPANLDYALLDELAAKYGTGEMKTAVSARAAKPADPSDGLVGGRQPWDDFAACGIVHEHDIADLYVKPFWFGCEAEDRMSAWAFRAENNAFGARLQATFGSDIGHFDVADMARVLPEAHELVDDGLMTDADFKDFCFTNPVRFFAGSNPEFLRGHLGRVRRVRGAVARPRSP